MLVVDHLILASDGTRFVETSSTIIREERTEDRRSGEHVLIRSGVGAERFPESWIRLRKKGTGVLFR